ncbi:hypothetical protein AB1Y20_015388 [Prymnesium parvum]|uniref:N-acetyltransferase domain-containing protein n=1 Tax=Prymnesium parvum TaxID=97485 RepID=A0AB34JXL3_PRYPA
MDALCLPLVGACPPPGEARLVSGATIAELQALARSNRSLCSERLKALGFNKLGARKRLELMLLAGDSLLAVHSRISSYHHLSIPPHDAHAPPRSPSTHGRRAHEDHAMPPATIGTTRQQAHAPSAAVAQVSPPLLAGVAIHAGAVPLHLRRAWLASERQPPHGHVSAEMTLVQSLCLGETAEEQDARCHLAASLVKRGVLRRRMQFGIRLDASSSSGDTEGCHEADGEAVSGAEGGWDRAVGCVEVLLVRCSLQPSPTDCSCRFCLSDDDEADLDEEATAAAVLLASADGRSLRVAQRGRLRKDVCACRGSVGCVHDGCLVEYMAATEWGGARCPTCKQRFVGPSALAIARIAARSTSEGEALMEQAELQALGALGAAHDEATALWEDGQFAQAVARFREVIQVVDAIPPPSCGTAESRRATQLQRDHLATSAAHNLGLALHSLGSHDDALEHICRALAGFEIAFGPRAPYSLKALHNVAMVTASAGYLSKAEEIYKLALLARCEVLGPDSPDTLKTACNRGLILHQMGRHEEAEQALADAERRARRVFGSRHPACLAIVHNRGLALSKLGPNRLNEAVGVVRKVLETRRDILGDAHPETLNTMSDLGLLMASDASSVNSTEARALLLKASQEAERTLGPSHPQTLRARARLHVLEHKSRGDGFALEAHKDDAPLRADIQAGEGEAVALLMHLYVSPSHRRCGIARAALRAVVQSAWAAQASKLVAVVATTNEPALHLLRDGGFSTVEELNIGNSPHSRLELCSPRPL